MVSNQGRMAHASLMTSWRCSSCQTTAAEGQRKSRGQEGVADLGRRQQRYPENTEQALEEGQGSRDLAVTWQASTCLERLCILLASWSRLCFAFNINGCDKAQPGEACAKGYHLCAQMVQFWRSPRPLDPRDGGQPFAIEFCS